MVNVLLKISKLKLHNIEECQNYNRCILMISNSHSKILIFKIETCIWETVERYFCIEIFCDHSRNLNKVLFILENNHSVFRYQIVDEQSWWHLVTEWQTNLFQFEITLLGFPSITLYNAKWFCNIFFFSLSDYSNFFS